MVLGHGLRSLAAVRVLRAWMYEMSVYDAPTFVAVAALLCIVAVPCFVAAGAAGEPR